MRFPNRQEFLGIATLCGALLLPAISPAQGVVTDDAYISVGPKSSDTNFGINPNLTVSSASTVFLKFRLDSLPSGTPGSAVERATLQLYLGNVTLPGMLDVYSVIDPWSEATITANNAPPLGPLVATTERIALNQRYKFLTIDITSLVRLWLGEDGAGYGGVPNQGVAIAVQLASPEIANIVFDSKENSQTSHEPRLEIVLTTDSEPPPSGVTAVTADSPLVVTNGTTTPNISLGIVPASLGGTGLGSPGNAGNFLRSDGTGWTSAALSSADIPLNLGSYIQNGTAQQASANFNIAGTGTANIFNATTQFNIAGNRMLTATGGAGSLAYSNAIVGLNAGLALTPANGGSFDGNLNAMFGFNSGQFTTTGCCNSFFGNYSGWQNTTGRSNAFMGGSAGTSNTTGSFNAFFGDLAAIGNTTGFQNTAVGYFSGISMMTGNNNTFLGAFTTGAANLSFATAIGAGAAVSSNNTIVLGRSLDTVQVPGGLTIAGSFSANIVNAATQFNIAGVRILGNPGQENLFSGANAGASNTSGISNAFFGSLAGQFNTTGSGNAFFGRTAGRQNTIGSLNSFFGSSAGASNTDGFGNSAFGGNAGAALTTGDANVFVGIQAGNLNSIGGNNTFIGAFSGDTNTTGSSITLLGGNTDVASNNLDHATAIGADVVVGSSNTVVIGRFVDTVQVPGTLSIGGSFSANILNAATQFNLGGARVLSQAGPFSVFVGSGSGANNTVGGANSFFGISAGNQNTTGSRNSFYGAFAGLSNVDGGSNSFFGVEAGKLNTSGAFNSFFGDGAGVSNTTGIDNSFFGYLSGQLNTIGLNNAFFGFKAGQNNVFGAGNAFFGATAGANSLGHSNAFFGDRAGLTNTSGEQNTAVGSLAGFNGVNSVGIGNTALGASATVAADVLNATAIGYHAHASQSHALVLGGVNGVNGSSFDTDVAIGTTAPKARLDVTGGDILVGSPGRGIILKSPDGATCRRIAIDNTGAFVVSAVACP